MNYSAAVNFLLGRTDYERWPGYAYAGRFDLRRMDELLARLGNPQLAARSVHIAGSKGKGSTAAMIAAALEAAGYTAGLYTSPHLITLRERIKVGGRSILKRELSEVVSVLRPHVAEADRRSAYGELTTFELLTAAAFVHFQRRQVDFQVLETGLGGRLDATNVVTPEVSVITSIGLEHTDVLGKTVAEIAAEKAGIIKPGVPVVSSRQEQDAAKVIAARCREKGARLIAVGTDVTWRETAFDLSGQSLHIDGVRGPYDVRIPLLGEYQLENAATAVAALETLDIPGESIAAGLGRVSWPGRLQILRRRPLLVVDGAHSADSARRLREALERHFHFARLILIIGISADKDAARIAAQLAPIADMVIATRARHPRASAAAAVASEFSRQGRPAEIAADVAQALALALERAERGDLICATGSLFLVGEMIEYVRDLRPEPYPV
jgi:dihydrofolate synthase/folylpolyglutamate synthase